jgi:hypothetical protein
VAVLRGVGGFERRRHQGEDPMQRDGAQEGEAVDVAEVEAAREGEEDAEGQEVHNGSREVGVVHYVLVDTSEGVEDG